MPREALRSRLEVDARAFNRLAALASERGMLAEEGTLVRLPGHEVRFSAAQEQAVAKLDALIARNPMSTPSVKEAEALAGEEVLQALFEQGRLVQVSPEVLFDLDTYHRLVDEVRAFISRSGSITVAQARDVFQTSRKYALALLEHLDETGVTRRTGDERTLR
jgi:selenocysteine-specific elongation factor